MKTMVSRTICTRHNFVATVGRNVQFALDEYECPTCVAIADDEYARERQQREDWAELAAKRGHPSICLCNACSPEEAEYARWQESEEANRFSIEIVSSNYCDHSEEMRQTWGRCDATACRNVKCATYDPPF